MDHFSVSATALRSGASRAESVSLLLTSRGRCLGSRCGASLTPLRTGSARGVSSFCAAASPVGQISCCILPGLQNPLRPRGVKPFLNLLSSVQKGQWAGWEIGRSWVLIPARVVSNSVNRATSSTLAFAILAWYGSCSAADRKALQRRYKTSPTRCRLVPSC